MHLDAILAEFPTAIRTYQTVKHGVRNQRVLKRVWNLKKLLVWKGSKLIQIGFLKTLQGMVLKGSRF